MADFFGYLGGVGKIFSINTLYYLIIALIFIGLIAWLIITINNKRTYVYKARIFRIREGEKYKEGNYKAGYINRKNSAPFFRIKTGWFKTIDLTTTPNPKYIDEENRVYYKQIDINTYVQLQRTFEAGKFVMTPVESDVKYGAILSIQRIKDVLRTESTWKKILPFAGLIILAIVFIVAYAMLMKSCGG